MAVWGLGGDRGQGMWIYKGTMWETLVVMEMSTSCLWCRTIVLQDITLEGN